MLVPTCGAVYKPIIFCSKLFNFCFHFLHIYILFIVMFVLQLLYFAADPDPLEGFLRGLSLAANQPMPSSKSLVHLPQPMTDEYGGDVSVPQIQVCKTLFSTSQTYK